MATTGKTEAELIALLNEELREYEACNDVRVSSIDRLENGEGDHDANWDANWLRGSGTHVISDCMRVFLSAKLALQRKYHLLTDD